MGEEEKEPSLSLRLFLLLFFRSLPLFVVSISVARCGTNPPPPNFPPGGGWCYNETLCAERAKGTLGSSTKLPSTFEFPSGYVSTSQEGNTAFYDANRVVLWYCDGASFSGNRDGTVKAGDQTLYFRGWRNLQAIISQLKDKHNLSQAKEVLLSGGSAGGLAAFLHADYVKTLLPPSVKKYKVGPSAALPLARHHLAAAQRLFFFSSPTAAVCLQWPCPLPFPPQVSPASGFFMDHVDASGAPYYPMNMRYVYNMQNASRGVNQACYTAMAPHNKDYSCIYAQNSYAFTQAPIFPLQSALDSWQMGNVYPRNVGDWKACVTNHFANCNATEVRRRAHGRGGGGGVEGAWEGHCRLWLWLWLWGGHCAAHLAARP